MTAAETSATSFIGHSFRFNNCGPFDRRDRRIVKWTATIPLITSTLSMARQGLCAEDCDNEIKRAANARDRLKGLGEYN
jgi:hypothetical protein